MHSLYRPMFFLNRRGIPLWLPFWDFAINVDILGDHIFRATTLFRATTRVAPTIWDMVWKWEGMPIVFFQMDVSAMMDIGILFF